MENFLSLLLERRKNSVVYAFWNYDVAAGIYQCRLHREDGEYYEYAGREGLVTRYERPIRWVP
jgi:hypothetical protein